MAGKKTGSGNENTNQNILISAILNRMHLMPPLIFFLTMTWGIKELIEKLFSEEDQNRLALLDMIAGFEKAIKLVIKKEEKDKEMLKLITGAQKEDFDQLTGSFKDKEK